MSTRRARTFGLPSFLAGAALFAACSSSSSSPPAGGLDDDAGGGPHRDAATAADAPAGEAAAGDSAAGDARSEGGRGSPCSSTSECRAYSNYCGGCACNALRKDDAAPVCDGGMVACFADPCGNLAAACVDGACTLTSRVADAGRD